MTVTPFTLSVPESDLADLRERLSRTRWPEQELDPGQGAPLAYVREVCETWRTTYDWRVLEARLNGLGQVTTEIDGVTVHALHVRSPEPGARPLLMTHGWPGSVVEFLDVIGPLTDPVAHGGDATDAFHLVMPSLPGYGLSSKPTESGWGLDRIASAWTELMHRLGYDRFLAQGGDWGALVTMKMAVTQTHVLDGIHLNLAVANPEALMALGDPTAEEAAQLGKLQHYMTDLNGYSQLQATRPQTVGYALTDSPAGQCAWILEKMIEWTDSGRDPEKVISRERMLDNISLYWLTATAASSARLYWEAFTEVLADMPPIDVPTAYSLFPEDVFAFSERWMRTRFSDLRYFRQVDRGGHFAAMEQPELFVQEVRAGFRAVA